MDDFCRVFTEICINHFKGKVIVEYDDIFDSIYVKILHPNHNAFRYFHTNISIILDMPSGKEMLFNDLKEIYENFVHSMYFK